MVSEKKKTTANRFDLSLQQKLSKAVLEEIAHYYKAPFVSKKNIFEQYESMSDEVLANIFRAFVQYEKDASGRYFEWRFGEFVHSKFKCDKVEFRPKLIGKDSITHEIDVVGKNKDGDIIVIAECKAKGGPPSREDIAKWLNSTEQILKTKIGDKLLYSCFASTSPFTQDAIKMVQAKGGDNGEWRALFKSVSLKLFEELEGRIKRIYPQKEKESSGGLLSDFLSSD